jgi:hypothetical protein
MMLALVIALGIVDAGLLVWNWRLSKALRERDRIILLLLAPTLEEHGFFPDLFEDDQPPAVH